MKLSKKSITGPHKIPLSGYMDFIALCMIILLSLTGCMKEKSRVENLKPRLVITCDPELDDFNTLIRLLLYSTDFRVEGLVYASSQYHWKGDGKGTKWFVPGREYTRFGLHMGPMESWRWAKDEHFIHDAVNAYAKVYPNLKVHNPGYPTPEYLKSKIRYGNIEFDGDISKDSPGSDLIKSLMLDDVPGPLFISAQGGASTIARALKSIQDKFENTAGWDSLKKRISGKVILLLSGDQDDTYASYIKPNWPDIGNWELRGGIMGLGYNAQANASRYDAVFYTPGWMERNITSKGPLGALYRVWGDGKQMVRGDIFDYFGLSGYSESELRRMGYIVWAPVREKGSFLGEGDTHIYLNLIDNGLRADEDVTYGGWGGRKAENPGRRDSSGQQIDSTMSIEEIMRLMMRPDTIFPDFLPALQNNLAARFMWSVTPLYEDANHGPAINGPLRISAKPGEKVQLSADVSDPDGNDISVKWWQFRVGSYKGNVIAEDPSSMSTSVVVPQDAKPGQTIHMILEATDNGKPEMTRYHRIIITVV